MGFVMIYTEGLCKEFDGLVAVDGLDLHVRAGEILALLGPNGAGKTTTVRMLASILQPTRGRAWIAGHDVVQEAVIVRHLVGVLTETPGLYRRMRAGESDRVNHVLTELFRYYMAHPAELPDGADAAGIPALARRVCDHLAGMTDRFAAQQFESRFVPRRWRGID